MSALPQGPAPWHWRAFRGVTAPATDADDVLRAILNVSQAMPRGVVANGGTIHGPYRTFARFRVGACALRRDITDAASVCHRACG